MLTGYATMESAIEAVNQGIDGFLTKPSRTASPCQDREFNVKKRLKQFVPEQVLGELQKRGRASSPSARP
jgi:ActR/RegA family two-component response regulator